MCYTRINCSEWSKKHYFLNGVLPKWKSTFQKFWPQRALFNWMVSVFFVFAIWRGFFDFFFNFQMEILSLSLILITPNRGWKKKHILIFFLISLQNVRKKGRVELCQIFHPKNWCADICKAQFLPSNLNFTLKTVLLSNAISSFFSRHGLYFHPTKDCRSTRPYSPFFNIYCYFGQIFCTEVIQLFSRNIT